MTKKLYQVGLLGMAMLTAFTSCSEEQQFTSENRDAKRVEVQTLSPELAKVRDYVPLYAVVAHRGTTFWAPEETESAWRWAREMGADYLESDLQATKDGVILANHDENLKRTTNIENVYGDQIPASRLQFYMSLGFSEADARAQLKRDNDSFRSFYTNSYYYHELLALDAGSWFNETSLEQARPAYAKQHQYISALQDQIAYAEGKILKRDDKGERVLPYKIKPEYQGKTLEEIAKMIKDKGAYQSKYMDFIEYDFANAYVKDPQDTGHRPGIYIELKESWTNPTNMEQRVYDVLDQTGWNIMTKPEAENTPFYVDGKVNVGNTNGKVILQTFSFDALGRAYNVFKGKLPMCYLLWTSNPAYATDIADASPAGYANFIKMAQDKGAQIIGPSIAGAPNNYPELNKPWQAWLIRKSGMLNHPYSFDSYAQMTKYMGYWNYGLTTEFDDLLRIKVPKTPYSIAGDQNVPVYLDGYFTNRTEMSLRYMVENGFRGNKELPNPFHAGKFYDNSQANVDIPDAVKTLERLGY